jgi:malate dehydrogenase (oxaloacetate-decarboxylating)
MKKETTSLVKHALWRGKVELTSKIRIQTKEELAIAYTPGVAEPCLEIQRDESLAYQYTMKGNSIAVVTDGTAVLGLGDIGPLASLPVMEGKAMLFKQFAGINAFPIALDTKDPDEIVESVVRMAPTFGGINLEDISAPRCFEIEERLKKRLSIPVFHDDQHGTAIVVSAALKNAACVVGKNLADLKVVINGPGAAGIAIGSLLYDLGIHQILFCDRTGIQYPSKTTLNDVQKKWAERLNPGERKGSLTEALRGADVFVGVSAAGALQPEMIAGMNEKPIVFAMANPMPEIMPDQAKKAGVAVIGTGRSDYPNQINNLLAFPGVFRGTLNCRASEINQAMKMAAVEALAGLISKEELHADMILPSVFDERVVIAVAAAVKRMAIQTGVAHG